MNSIKSIITGCAFISLIFISCTPEEIPVGDYYDSESNALQVNENDTVVVFDEKDHFDEVRFASNFWWDVELSKGDDGSPAGEAAFDNYTTKPWVTITPEHNYGNRPVRVTIPRNVEKHHDRFVWLKFYSKDKPEWSRSLKLVQKKPAPFIDTDLQKLEFSVFGSAKALLLTTTEKWEIKSSESWCKVEGSISGGTKTRDLALNISADVIPENERIQGQVRKATLTITSSEDPKLVRTIEIEQSEYIEHPEISAFMQDAEGTSADPFLLKFKKVRGADYGYTLEIYKPGQAASGTPLLVVQPKFSTEDLLTLNELTVDLMKYIDFDALASIYSGAVDLVVKAHFTDKATDFSSSSLNGVTLFYGSGSGNGNAEGNEFLIKNFRHFSNINYNLSSSFKQMVDLNLSEKELNPIGRKAVVTGTLTTVNYMPFSGSYDGNRKTIRHLLQTATTTNDSILGLFGRVSGSITNLRLASSVIANSTVSLPFASKDPNGNNRLYTWGPLVGHLTSGGYIGNCVTDSCDIDFTKNLGTSGSGEGVLCAGGMVGANIGGTIEKCITRNGLVRMVSQAYSRGMVARLGGITGTNGFHRVNAESLLSVIRNCTNESTQVTQTGPTESTQLLGAFVLGGISGTCVSQIINCTNYAPVTGTGHIGGITGGTANYGHSSATVTGWQTSARPLLIDHCVNYGAIKAIPLLGTGTAYIGDINYVGGIIGFAGCSNTNVAGSGSSLITNSCNFGAIDFHYNIAVPSNIRKSYLGGIVGAQTQSMVLNCFNGAAITVSYPSTGTVGTAELYLGGISGYLTESTQANVTSSYNSGLYSNAQTINSHVWRGCIGGGATGFQNRIIDCYALNAGSNPGDGISVTGDQLKNQSTFTNWDFTSVWKMPADGTYPKLIGVGAQSLPDFVRKRNTRR